MRAALRAAKAVTECDYCWWMVVAGGCGLRSERYALALVRVGVAPSPPSHEKKRGERKTWR